MNQKVGGKKPLKVHLSSRSQSTSSYKLEMRKRLAMKEIHLMLRRQQSSGVNTSGHRSQRLMRNEYFLTILFYMQGRKGNGLSVFAEVKTEQLRKIQANDRFPCFACFDDQKEKMSCKECCGKGWIFGSHPMVQFAEDFIEKRLGGFSFTEMNNSSGQNSDFGEIGIRMSGSYDPRKRSSRDMFSAASTKTVALADEIRDSNCLQVEQPLAQQYYCNQCPSRDLPIKGKRFHCP